MSIDNLEGEVWKDIKGYEGYYQVSNMGRVKSLKREVIDKRGRVCHFKERILNPGMQKSGYYTVGLSKNCINRTFAVHTLVALEFLGYTMNGKIDFVVDHIDEDKLNNTLSNLQIISNIRNVLKGRSYKFGKKKVRHSFGKWESSIIFENKIYKLGKYDAVEKARKAYLIASEEAYKYGKILSYRKIHEPVLIKKKTSKYKNVHFQKNDNIWVSTKMLNGKQKYIGSFKTELEAHNAVQEYLNSQENK